MTYHRIAIHELGIIVGRLDVARPKKEMAAPDLQYTSPAVLLVTGLKAGSTVPKLKLGTVTAQSQAWLCSRTPAE